MRWIVKQPNCFKHVIGRHGFLLLYLQGADLFSLHLIPCQSSQCLWFSYLCDCLITLSQLDSEAHESCVHHIWVSSLSSHRFSAVQDPILAKYSAPALLKPFQCLHFHSALRLTKHKNLVLTHFMVLAHSKYTAGTDKSIRSCFYFVSFFYLILTTYPAYMRTLKVFDWI